MKYVKSLAVAVLGATALLSTTVMASENHEISASLTSFKPLVIKIAPGDTVSWTNMNTHFVQTKEGFIPEGAEGFASAMSENFQTKPLTVEGAYFYTCPPHWGMGMGGVIIVGEPTNLQEIIDSKPKGALRRLVKKAEKEM